MYDESRCNEEAEDRFAIYRNNVTLSLITAIADTFPVVKRLVGDDCFNAAATTYIRKYPPTQPSLLFYGEDFIEFIKYYPGCDHLQYLGDVAQLEWYYIRVFHAQDSRPMDLEILQQVEPAALGDISFIVRPSVQLMNSDWPVDTIWEANLNAEVATLELSDYSGSYLLFHRQEWQVQVINITAECFNFLSALNKGLSINNAWLFTLEKQEQENRPEINENELTGMLGYLLALELFSEVRF